MSHCCLARAFSRGTWVSSRNMTTPVRRVHRVGKYIPKPREAPEPPPRVFEDFEDDVTEHMARIVPVARPARMALPAARTPVRLRKTEVLALPVADYATDDITEPGTRLRTEAPVPVVDSAPASPKGEAPWYGVLDNIQERIDENGFSYFIGAYSEARKQADVDAREMMDPDDVPLEAEEVIAVVENELGDERAIMAAAFTKARVQIAERGIRSLKDVLFAVKNGVPEIAKTGLTLIDTDTREKAYKALLEIVPAISFWYAVTGKRLVYPNGGGLRHSQPEFQDIGTIERAMYAVGSVVYLGEIFNGVRHELARKGLFDIARQQGIIAAAKMVLTEASQLVSPTIARAQQHGIRQLTKDRSKGIMDEKL